VGLLQGGLLYCHSAWSVSFVTVFHVNIVNAAQIANHDPCCLSVQLHKIGMLLYAMPSVLELLMHLLI
jgi:hypothetical protein